MPIWSSRSSSRGTSVRQYEHRKWVRKDRDEGVGRDGSSKNRLGLRPTPNRKELKHEE